MASFLDSIGYNLWVLPALLAIPLIGAVILLLLPVRKLSPTTVAGSVVIATSGPAAGDGIETPAARHVALWLFVLEFLVSLGLWWSFNPADNGWQGAMGPGGVSAW